MEIDDVGVFDLDDSIKRAIRNKTLVPRAIYNIKLKFGKLELLMDDIVDGSSMSNADYVDCVTIMKTGLRNSVCRLLLAFGLPMLDNNNFHEALTSSLVIWLEATASKHSFAHTLLITDSMELLISNELINFLTRLKKDISSIDNDVIDILDFFTYIDHRYISINNFIMYKSFNDEVLSILRF